MHFSSHQQPTIAPAGRKLRRAWNPRSAILPQDEVATTQLIDSAVMLSEAKHLCLFPSVDRSRFDPRFFASLRMTLRTGLLSSRDVLAWRFDSSISTLCANVLRS